MKKILCLLCAFALAVCFVACNKKPGNDEPSNNESVNNSAADELAEALHPQDFTFSADWPEEELAEQVPQPSFDTTIDEPSDKEYYIVCEATVDQLKEYVEELKAAGFTINENTTEESAFGVFAYYFTASNEEGYTAEVNYSNTLGSMATIRVKKPS